MTGSDRREPGSDDSALIDRFLQADIAETGIGSKLEAFLSDFDRLDAVVNNAAMQIEKPLIEMSDAEWELIMATNVRAAFIVSRTAYPSVGANLRCHRQRRVGPRFRDVARVGCVRGEQGGTCCVDARLGPRVRPRPHSCQRDPAGSRGHADAPVRPQSVVVSRGRARATGRADTDAPRRFGIGDRAGDPVPRRQRAVVVHHRPGARRGRRRARATEHRVISHTLILSSVARLGTRGLVDAR